MHTCRFCNVQESRGMVKYAARHWAHFECWLYMKGRELSDPVAHQQILDLLQASFHDWQLKQFPVFKLADWLEQKKTQFPAKSGKSWVDKACWLLQTAVEANTVTT